MNEALPQIITMMRHVSFILLLEWTTTFQRLLVYRIPIQKEKGATLGILVSRFNNRW